MKDETLSRGNEEKKSSVSNPEDTEKESDTEIESSLDDSLEESEENEKQGTQESDNETQNQVQLQKLSEHSDAGMTFFDTRSTKAPSPVLERANIPAGTLEAEVMNAPASVFQDSNKNEQQRGNYVEFRTSDYIPQNNTQESTKREYTPVINASRQQAFRDTERPAAEFIDPLKDIKNYEQQTTSTDMTPKMIEPQQRDFESLITKTPFDKREEEYRKVKLDSG